MVFENHFILFFKTVLRTPKTTFEKFTSCSIDLQVFFIEIEIIKANESILTFCMKNTSA